MGRTTTRAAALAIALAWATVVGCSAAPADSTGAAPSGSAATGSGTTVDEPTGTSPTTTGTTPPPVVRAGRYVEEVFPEIEQVYDDAVFKTAAEAPGFGGSEAKDLLIDVWVPVGDDLETRPLMIFQFGGGFRFGDRNQLAALAAAGARRGFVTAAFDYRIGTGWQRPGPARRRRARTPRTRWRGWSSRADELGFDPDAIISTGASAGAVNSIHMIVMEPDQADVTVAGVVSLSGANLTGQAPVAGGPPIIMFSGTQDVIVPFNLQTRFCEQYVAAGNICEQHTYDAGHMGGDQADIQAKSVGLRPRADPPPPRLLRTAPPTAPEDGRAAGRVAPGMRSRARR